MHQLIGVIGAGECDKDIYNRAFQVGQEIATQGYGMVCGGLGGVMEAAAKGCQQNGGITVGIIPQEDVQPANSFLDIVIPTGMGIMRNLLVVRTAMGLIAVGGRFGTLSEIAFGLQLKKPLVALNSWDVSEAVYKAQTPSDAVSHLIEQINSKLK